MHEDWMRIAIEEAAMAAREGEVPVGAVALLEGEVLARDHNRSIQLNDPCAHAEILVLRAAGKRLGNYRLAGVELYTTIEPCPMCAGAAVWARIRQVVFGARDAKGGGVVSKAQLFRPGLFNHNLEFREGVLEEECRGLLQDFFAARRS